MAPMVVALILVPPPFLSLHPSQGVSVGDTVTLRCHLPQPAAWVRLYPYENPRYIEQKDKVQKMEFSLAGIKLVDAVGYQCQYQGLEPAGKSQKSDPVELLVTGEGTGENRLLWAVPTGLCSISVTPLHSDHSYPPPGISLSPKARVEIGTNVTIQCWNKKYGAAFLLHKEGCSAAAQHQKTNGGGTATFTLFGVTPADSGTYRCSYRIDDFYLLFSPRGDNVTLEVISRSALVVGERNAELR
ncbi:hypothetical protein CIB84_016868 [Bambusicola thoracicus]|uniref:Immunoglobulin domain-containing protein n=1 Tax=Bambusicola thoracicus TaxID=9083 RepID=A0A2P4S5Q5_BAMTH|nr:hypothetical protein CIB84_016868 [Bambusicola thoracicus]